jgi:hypothetical protein
VPGAIVRATVAKHLAVEACRVKRTAFTRDVFSRVSGLRKRLKGAHKTTDARQKGKDVVAICDVAISFCRKLAASLLLLFLVVIRQLDKLPCPVTTSNSSRVRLSIGK